MTTAPALAARGANARRHLGARREQHDVDALEVERVEVLHLEDVVLAERHLAADRARRGDGATTSSTGKLALGEDGQDLAADIAGRADHRYLERHNRITPGKENSRRGVFTYAPGPRLTRGRRETK